MLDPVRDANEPNKGMLFKPVRGAKEPYKGILIRPESVLGAVNSSQRSVGHEVQLAYRSQRGFAIYGSTRSRGNPARKLSNFT